MINTFRTWVLGVRCFLHYRVTTPYALSSAMRVNIGISVTFMIGSVQMAGDYPSSPAVYASIDSDDQCSPPSAPSPYSIAI